MGAVQPTAASTITVTTALDESDGSCSDGDCSVRDALATAVSGDTVFLPSGNYVLTLGELTVTKDLFLVGASPAPVIDGNASSRVLEIDGNYTLNLNNLVIANGLSDTGGGILVRAGRLVLENTAVRQNVASINGGGIYIGTEGKVTITSGEISQNEAGLQGGGIFNMDGTLVQDGGSIDANSAGSGGGVHVNLEIAQYTLNGGSVENNSATSLEKGGGGIFVAAGQVVINGGQVAGNNARRGGGILSATGTITLNDGAIEDNLAEYGGGVYLTFPEALLVQNGGEISGNSSANAEFGGGGVLGFQGSMTLTGGIISQNTAVSYGGGITIRLGELNVTGGTITNNTAGTQGGGIFAEEATVDITNLQLGQNSAPEGGGLYLSALANLEISNTAVFSNTATTNGGGLTVEGTALITNTTISGNEAQASGGGLWSQNGSATLKNVTIGQNSAASGGGIYNNGATISLHNTLIAENSAGVGPACNGSSLDSLGYNFIQNSSGCSLAGTLTGNILDQDPLLEPLTLNDQSTFIYPLAVTSPAVDAGDPADCPAVDQHNRPRPLDGNLDGTVACDIGSFEYGIPLSIGDVTITEGDAGSTIINFPVTLGFAAPVIVTVNYASSDQSATAGTDYSAVSGTLTFDPGETNHTIPVQIFGDEVGEADETFVITLSTPTYAFLLKSQGIGTILNDDQFMVYLPIMVKP